MKYSLPAALIVLTLVSCGTPSRAPEGPGPPPPTSWKLSLAVMTSDQLHVTGGSIDAFEHLIEVQVSADKTRPADHCSVAADLTGYGGPRRWVGKQISTRVRGRPALRNGAGAEGPYLTWQDGNGRWISVLCEHESTMAEVADRVRPDQASALTLPVGVTPSMGYVVTGVQISRNPIRTSISVDRLDRDDNGTLEVSLDLSEPTEPPTGEPTTIGGRPGLRSDDPKFPSVCVAARPSPLAYVCVGIAPNDTGPDLDRTNDRPAIESLAASLRFADLDDPGTWFDADRALR